MDIVIEIVGELIFELLFEGAVYASTNKKIPLILRVILIILVTLFIAAVIGLVFFAGITMLKKYMIAGILIIGIGIILLISACRKFGQTYLPEVQGRKENVK